MHHVSLVNLMEPSIWEQVQVLKLCVILLLVSGTVRLQLLVDFVGVCKNNLVELIAVLSERENRHIVRSLDCFQDKYSGN